MSGLPHFNYYLNQSNQNLNKYNQIENFSNNGEDVFAMFYAPWCPHCKTAEPEFDNSLGRIAVDYEDYIKGNYKKHKGKVVLVKINGDNHPELIQKVGVQGFPTFKLFKSVTERDSLKAANSIEYQDARNQSAFTQFCESNLDNDLEHFTNYTSPQYEAFEDYTLDYDYSNDKSLYN